MSGRGTGTGNTMKATSDDAPPNCGFDVVNDSSPGLWYTFTGTGCSVYHISTCNEFTKFDTEISVFTGSIDDSTGMSVSRHIYVQDKPPHYDILDDVPQHALSD